MKRTLLSLMLLVASIASFAYDFQVGKLYYNILSESDQTCEVTSGTTKYTGQIVIPEQVTYSGKNWSVTSIRQCAFLMCSGLTSVTIGNSVTSIGVDAFYECSGLTSVVFNAKRCEMKSSSDSPMFYGCNNLKEVIIGNEVEWIPAHAFYKCSGLTSVTIGNSVTSIGEYAFCGCSGLTSVTIPNSVTSIGHDAFSYCYGLTNVTIGNSVTSIGHDAFYKCSGLTSITIPNSVTSIGRYAFYNCSGLTSVTIPNSVTSIGDGAFVGCSGLTSVIFNAKRCEDMDINSNIFGYWNNNLKEVIIGNEVEWIPARAFCGCSSLTSVTIPNSVTNIGRSAFNDCSSLTSITIPESVASIEEYTFAGCKGLTSVSIGNSVTTIGQYAFAGCSDLTNVTIPESVTSVGYSAFEGCSGLMIVTIPNSVTSVRYSAFKDCSSLADVLISCKEESDFCDYIQRTDIYDVFCRPFPTSATHTLVVGGKEMTTVAIPGSVTNIGDYAFYNCSGLTNVTIPNSLTNVGNNIFDGCTSLPVVDGAYYADCYMVRVVDKTLSEYKLKENTRFIGSSAFAGCNNMRKLELPKTVCNIGTGAFGGCTVLTSLTVKAVTPPVCNSNALSGITKAACQLYIPYGTTADYQAAAEWKNFIYYNEMEKETEEDTSLEKPTITLEDGLLRIRSNVKDAKRFYNITSEDMQEGATNRDVVIDLAGVYSITAYIMTTDGRKSPDATATLVWANPTMEGTGIMNMEMKKALLLRSNGKTITIDGLEEGEMLELYSTNGMMLDKVVSSGTSATLGNGLQKHQIYIIKAGDRSIKYKF